jgi:phenylalanyl-tRNA synthetase beta subunit
VKSKFADEFVWEKLQFSSMYYQKVNKNWESDLLLTAKWELEDMLLKFGLKWSVNYIKTDKKAYHPKKQWNISYNDWNNDYIIWFVWTIHPLVLKENKIAENADLIYLSLDLVEIDKIVQKVEFKPEWYETLQDQIVWRDLCFVVNSEDDYGNILDIVKNVEWVDDLAVFDLYKWENIAEWKKSIAFKIKIKWEDMQTEHINEVMKNVITQVEKSWAKLRD